MGRYSELLNADKLDDKQSYNSSSMLSQSTNQSKNKLNDRSTGRSSRRSTNKVLERPKAFYITDRLDMKIDEAVDYFQNVHGIKKIDRSVVVTAILNNEDLWTDQSLDRLVDRMMSELTSRLTN